MAEDIKSDSLPEEPLIRLLEQTSRYGLDQETMLIYISSVNLMSILGLIGRRYGGKSNLSLPIPADLPAFSPTASGTAPAGGQSMENLMGMLMKMLGGQGGGNTPAAQGINPAALLNLINVLGQNVDLGSLMSMMAGMLGSGAKAAGTEGGSAVQPAPGIGQPVAGVKENNADPKAAGEEKQVKREVPRIMKWDQLDERKKA
ncbi:MAG: hypothetical protein PHP51_01870 [Desulfotomaculaceae bacterium]|nr:hypothetical protein [Desulfotomaculaceae bacterium]MDD4766596.1 hypothetical protein [Desulfotomaculaceae bacterium]